MFRYSALSLFLLSASISFASDEMVSIDEARQFFAHGQALGESYDVAIADLYADDARIIAFRRYPHGLERAAEFSGSQWKVLIQSLMPIARSRNDRSEYEDVSFNVEGNTVRIRARRYSVRKCYWDDNYYMIIAKKPGGKIQVIEEYTESQPLSDC